MAHAEPATKLDLKVFGTLIVLLALTYEAARHDFGNWNFPIALTIAAIKATLIVIFFMKLKRSVAMTQLVAGASVFWLFLLLGLTGIDYLTRGVVLGAP